LTRDEAKEYARRLLKESGASDEDVTQYLKLLDNDKFAQGFIPRPEVDRALDGERQKYRSFQERNDYLEKVWYPEAYAAYQKNLQGIQMLERYQQLYGALDNADSRDIRQAAEATGLTEEKVRELLQAEVGKLFAPRDRAQLTLMDLRDEYRDTFGKRMPTDEFEKFVDQQQRSGEYEGLRSAYQAWIAPKMEETRTKHQEERDKKIREEAIRDFASRHKIPVESRSTEVGLLFERMAQDRKQAGEGKSAREEFLEIMNDPDPGTLKQRYS
jgi:hypothetical protein